MQKKTPRPKVIAASTVEDIDYDSLWKDMITNFGYQFIRRFLPDMYPHLDQSYPIEYLEQEFPSGLRPRKKGRKITDKLMKVRLKSGEDHFVLTHVEVQATGESTYAKKMYLYNSVIYLQRDTDITALVIYTTEHYPSQHNHYTRNCFGTEVSYKFNSFIISKQDERKMRKSDDIFDLAILACLYIIQTRNDMDKRLQYKKKIHKLAEEKNFSRLEMEKILIFVEEIIQLPELIELKFQKHIKFKNKKLETMEMTQNSKNMFAAMFEGMYGISVEALKKREAAAERKEAAIQRKEASLKLKTEEIQRQKEEREAQLILLLYLQNHLPIEQIALDYDFNLKIVKEVVEKYLKENNLTSNTEGS